MSTISSCWKFQRGDYKILPRYKQIRACANQDLIYLRGCRQTELIPVCSRFGKTFLNRVNSTLRKSKARASERASRRLRLAASAAARQVSNQGELFMQPVYPTRTANCIPPSLQALWQCHQIEPASERLASMTISAMARAATTTNHRLHHL